MPRDWATPIRAKYDAVVIIGEDDGDIGIGRKVSVPDFEGIRGGLSHTELISSDFPGNLLSPWVVVVNLQRPSRFGYGLNVHTVGSTLGRART